MFLTILTPTYNRGKLLKQCYKSLKEQKNLNFEWLIIDDGSNDNTKEIVQGFIDENILDIKYFYKFNGGKHTALNYGINKAKGEMTIILDSDDFLTNDATQTIYEVWQANKMNKELCGIAFHRGYKNGNIIGDKFPKDFFISDYIDCRMNLEVKGDKSEIYITEILKQYPFPEFKNEKFIGEHIVWVRMARKYKTLHVNKIIYITEYLEGGLTKSGRSMRIKCPLGGMESSKECVDNRFKMKMRLKNMMLYICYGFFAKKSIYSIIRESGNSYLAMTALIPSYILYIYWKLKY